MIVGGTSDDLYFQTLIKHSTVPVHPQWKPWLYKRATKTEAIESLTTHRIHGIRVHLNDENLAEDISNALKRGSLKKDLEIEPQLEVEFDSPGKAV